VGVLESALGHAQLAEPVGGAGATPRVLKLDVALLGLHEQGLGFVEAAELQAQKPGAEQRVGGVDGGAEPSGDGERGLAVFEGTVYWQA
jgi:hypothetical protein